MKTGYVEFYRRKYRFIDENRVYINRNTPVGESADFYERKAFGGRRAFTPVLKVEDSVVTRAYPIRHSAERKRWEYVMPQPLTEFLATQSIKCPESCEDVSIL